MRTYEAFQEILKNVFKRDDVRGLWGTELDGEVAWYLGHAFANTLKAGGAAAPQIVVGRDMRAGSPVMAAGLIRGIEAAGGRARDLGLCGSELIYYATGEAPDRYRGGAMVTASHNPAEYAGVKFVRSGAKPLSNEELKALKEETARLYRLHLDGALPGAKHTALVRRFVRKLAKVSGLGGRRKKRVALKVVVEAGNGMGGMTFRPIAERIEKLLPGTSFVFSNATPDGRFPACTPNPLLADYLALLGNRVREEDADLGICFDGDADRAGFVDDRGELIDASLVSIVLLELLAPMYPDRRHVMGNLNTSLRFTRFVKDRTFRMTPVGHAKIKELMRAAPFFDEQSGKSNVLVASEHSGHYFYPDFYYADSGMTTAIFMIRKARQVKAAGRTLADELAGARAGYVASGEINVRVQTDREAKEKIKKIADLHVPAGSKRIRRGVAEDPSGMHEVQEFAAEEPYDADKLAALDLRVDSATDESPAWWFSVRKSGNEPELRLNVESASEEKMAELREEILAIMRA